MLRNLIIFLCLLLTVNLYAEDAPQDTVQMYLAGRTVATINGKHLSISEFQRLALDNDNSQMFIDKYKQQKSLSIFVGGVSGFVLGYHLGGIINDKQLEPKVIVASGIGILISALLEKGYKKSIKRAIDSYNKGVREKKEIALNISSTKHGLGLVLSF